MKFIHRIELWGVPATLVAEAHATLPGDEQAPIELELDFINGEPVLRLKSHGVKEVIDRRNLENP